jgi:enoyl-CoA hydratase
MDAGWSGGWKKAPSIWHLAFSLKSVTDAGALTLEFQLRQEMGILHLTLVSGDGMNRLTRRKVTMLRDEIAGLMKRDGPTLPLVISGDPIFSAGADLHEIARLGAIDAFAFATTGQSLMSVVEQYPAPVYAAIRGYCMGGGLDLALACHHRIASPHAVFGHRGAALGLITGWGGTQRLPRLVGRAKALQMFVAAEKVHAAEALRIGLLDGVGEDPVAEAVERIGKKSQKSEVRM